MLLYWLFYRIGLMPFGYIMSMALLPMGFGGFISTLNWRGFICDYILLIPDFLIWYPFFKIYEKQLVEEEQALQG